MHMYKQAKSAKSPKSPIQSCILPSKIDLTCIHHTQILLSSTIGPSAIGYQSQLGKPRNIIFLASPYLTYRFDIIASRLSLRMYMHACMVSIDHATTEASLRSHMHHHVIKQPRDSSVIKGRRQEAHAPTRAVVTVGSGRT